MDGAHAGRVAHAQVEHGGGLDETYRQSLLDNFKAYVKTRRDLYASEQRWSDAGFWRRRLDETAYRQQPAEMTAQAQGG